MRTRTPQISRFLSDLDQLLEARDSAALEDLCAVDPRVERRVRALQGERARLEAEIRQLHAMLEDAHSISRKVVKKGRKISRRFKALHRAESHAVLDAFMTDVGGEGSG